jgi:hypothetical protein
MEPEERLKDIEQRLSLVEGLKDLTERCVTNELNISALTDRIDLLKRIEDLESDLRKWQWLGKYLSITSAVIIALASWLGLRSVRTLIDRTTREKERNMAKGKKHTPEQIVSLLRQIEVSVANGKTTPVACRESGMSEQT